MRTHVWIALAAWFLGSPALGLAGEWPQFRGSNSGIADELAQAADRLDADLIVIGSSGKLDLGEWLLGSIAEAVLHRSRRPVLVVPSLTL